MSQQIDQYEILNELGAGGMGVVYRARDLLLDREVAIKRLRNEFAATPGVLERFLKEAQLQARLSHPNIAHLHSLVRDGDSLCIVIELVDGTNLDRHMPMPWQPALSVTLQILEGLDYAHRRGVLHRDVKPENIMIDRDGAVRLMDFGIAHAIGSARLTRDQSIVGTIEYMAPERILGRESDQRSDIYSVGVLLFEMIAGRLPFITGSEFELLRAHIEAEPPAVSRLVSGVPEFVDSAIGKAMAKEPAARYASCAEMASALRVACANSGVALQSVAEWLNIKAREAGDTSSQQVRRWCDRIETLARSGDLEAAERLADTALNDFPGSVDLARLREKIRQASPRRPSSPGGVTDLAETLSEDELRFRQTLLCLLAAEKNEDWDQVREILQSALAWRPDGTAFRIAGFYLRSRLQPPGLAGGTM
jgi:serine/threonine protein kinase